MDIAVLRLKALDADGPPLPVHIRKAPVSNDILTIVHHPACEGKRINSKSCFVRDANCQGWQNSNKVDFTHRCDTEPGSSGAPIFDRDGLLVGLHHRGFEKNQDGVCVKDNKAVKMSEILKVLQKASISGLQVAE